jgi:hypothetical protein
MFAPQITWRFQSTSIPSPFLSKVKKQNIMRRPIPITITTGLAALVSTTLGAALIVLFLSDSFSAAHTIAGQGVQALQGQSDLAFASKPVVRREAKRTRRILKNERDTSVSKGLAAPARSEEDELANDSLWFLQHEDPATGKLPSGMIASWYNSDRALLNSSHESALTAGTSPIDTVKSIGPFHGDNPALGNNGGGRTRALLVSSASDNIMFAGCVDGGLWKSTNAGQYWLPVNDTAATLGVSCITQSPFNSNVIYYGTGEAITLHLIDLSDGVFKSTDGGTTFQSLSNTTNLGPSWAIEHDKNDSLTVYYGTLDSGLRRTTNGGSTWSLAPGTAGNICDIITFLPFSPGSDNVLIAKSDSGLYAATNGKTGSFTKITSAAFPAVGTFSRIKLGNCKSSPKVVYAAFSAKNGLFDAIVAFCKSTDGGATWSACANPHSAGKWDMMVGVNPLNSNALVVAGTTITYSSDGGTTWGGYTTGLYSDYHAYAFCNSSHVFFVGTDQGIVHRNWDSIITDFWHPTAWPADSNYATTQFFGGDFGPTGITCMGGSFDDGNWWFLSGNTTTDGLGFGDYAHISQQNPNLAYKTNNSFPHLERTSTFEGILSWTGIPPHGGSDTTNYPNLFQMNYADGFQLYQRLSGGVWRSIDSGDNPWTRLNSADISGVYQIGCEPAANPSIYFDGHDASFGHFYRIDTAKTFTPGAPVDLSSSLPITANWFYLSNISVYPSNHSELFVGSNYNLHHAYKVINATSAHPTWINISGTLPSTLGVNQIQADPLDSTSLLAATDYGLYYSGDKGVNWYKDPRIPNVIIKQMQLRASDRKLFLFTYGRGAWYISLKPHQGLKPVTTATPSTEISGNLEFSLYPNPAMEKLTVSPQQELSSSARITIYSSDGRMISESAWNPTGEVNIGSLPSGAYFLQIQDGDRIAKSKFVKM